MVRPGGVLKMCQLVGPVIGLCREYMGYVVMNSESVA